MNTLSFLEISHKFEKISHKFELHNNMYNSFNFDISYIGTPIPWKPQGEMGVLTTVSLYTLSSLSQIV